MQSMREIVAKVKHPLNKELRERESLTSADRAILSAVETEADYAPVQSWTYNREAAESPTHARDLRTFSIQLEDKRTVSIGRGWYNLRDDEGQDDLGTSYFVQVVDAEGKRPLLTLSDSVIAQTLFSSLSERLEFANQSLRAS